jgi:DMSO reductase family type II enzyme heme b subunit
MRLRAIPCLLALAAAAACRRVETPPTPEVVVVQQSAAPADPSDPAWRTAPAHVAALLLQDMVEPRLLTPSTPALRVQAASDGARVTFRLEWLDPTGDDLPRPGRFSDACAIQLPAQLRADVPAPQMGEAGKPVEITLWRASWQAAVDGRGDTIQDVYPRASIDHYPFEAAGLQMGSQEQREMAARYAPARALGNHMAGPRERPVQDLVAEGPGTLAAGPSFDSNGRGRRGERGWSVVISRRLPPWLAPGARSQAAFAVWEGSVQEAGARKMRTGWVPVVMGKKP